MEEANRTETTKDWRPAWRAFAERTRPKFEGTHGEMAQALPPNLQENREGPFPGFDSPPGRF